MADVVKDSKPEKSEKAEKAQASVSTKDRLIKEFLEKWNRDEFTARALQIVDAIKEDGNWPRYPDGDKIKFQISFRAKEEKSLKEKLYKLPIISSEYRGGTGK